MMASGYAPKMKVPARTGWHFTRPRARMGYFLKNSAFFSM